jgi:hypothetical protein
MTRQKQGKLRKNNNDTKKYISVPKPLQINPNHTLKAVLILLLLSIPTISIFAYYEGKLYQKEVSDKITAKLFYDAREDGYFDGYHKGFYDGRYTKTPPDKYQNTPTRGGEVKLRPPHKE